MKKQIFFILIILLFSYNAHSFQVQVENKTNSTYCYNILWVDHNWDSDSPALIMGGDIEPDEVRYNDDDYFPGTYKIIFFPCLGSNTDSEYVAITKIPLDVDVKIFRVTNNGIEID